MQTTGVHLAQFNTATLRHPIGHPATASFEALVDETNRHAEASPGFVWRHGIDVRDTSTTLYPDPLITVNASVWESLDHLREFVYRGFHRDVFRQRAEWFVASDQVMWWIPAGTVPTLAECAARLAFINTFGPSAYGFRTGQQFPQLVMRRHPLTDPVVTELVTRLDHELLAATPDGGTNFFHVDTDEVSPGNGAFFVAWLDGVQAACGAWRRIDAAADRAHTGEVKRMWVDPSTRGSKLGAAVLATLETDARASGITELRLETGEYLTAAVALYRRFGFEACSPWGDYVGAAHSYTMAKPLA